MFKCEDKFQTKQIKLLKVVVIWMRYGRDRINCSVSIIDLLALFDHQLFAYNIVIEIKCVLFISGKPTDMFISLMTHFKKFYPLAVISSVCFPSMLNVCCLLTAGFFLFQITLVIWSVIRIGPNGCDSMEFHESGLLRFKQVSDMGVIHPLYKSTVGGRRNENLVITGNNQPVSYQT